MTSDALNRPAIDRWPKGLTDVTAARCRRPARRGVPVLWLIVVGAFVFTALAATLVSRNSVRDVSTDVLTYDAESLGQVAILMRVWYALNALALATLAVRPGAVAGIGRLARTPVVWIALYQCIIAFHLVQNGSYWDLGRLTGSWLLLVTCMGIAPQMSLKAYTEKALWISRAMVLIIVFGAVLTPSLAWEYAPNWTFLPGTAYRLATLGRDCNLTGGVAGVAFLIELATLLGRRQRSRLSYLYLFLGFFCLVAPQSKAALLAALVAAAYCIANSPRFRSLSLLRPAVFGTVLVTSVSAMWFLSGDWLAANSGTISTLTGRTQLWQKLLTVAQEHVLLGYGPDLWTSLKYSPSFEFKYAAGNAHNQIVNSLLMAGAVGVALWLVYVFALLRGRRWLPEEPRTLYTALLIFLIIRSLAEFGLEPGDLSTIGQTQTLLLGFWLCRRTGTPARATLSRRPYAVSAFDRYEQPHGASAL